MKPIGRIVYSSYFLRSLKKLTPDLRKEANERELMFRRDCFNPKLKTHKLTGRHQGLWSFSVTYKHRVIFRFLNEQEVLFIDVGDHSIYQ